MSGCGEDRARVRCDVEPTLPLRETLKEHFVINGVAIDTFQVSSDRTIKNAFRLYDGNIVEGVLIPTDTRMTAVSPHRSAAASPASSARPVASSACATSTPTRSTTRWPSSAGSRRSATSSRCRTSSSWAWASLCSNYANVPRAIDRIGSQDGLGMAMKRITVSTAGIAKMIRGSWATTK